MSAIEAERRYIYRGYILNYSQKAIKTRVFFKVHKIFTVNCKNIDNPHQIGKKEDPPLLYGLNPETKIV
ncbi:hypothetical protein [Trichocoleus sp. FACHB-90]|uniref:hypothetical protein n=1 Tax=Trichocoleus sp. FACHB-90 TaxID=2692876 RepID=UPI001A7E46B5|nr:hypothetical protein [Trichocoleus sp. FACHB-90]